MMLGAIVAVFTMLPVLLLGFLTFSQAAPRGYPRVIIRQGILRGQYLKTDNNRTFSSFTGIPYGNPPVGELRFEPPRSANKWRGIKDATQLHNACPQTDYLIGGNSFGGNEDCLYLNVYTPKTRFGPYYHDKRPYPVMVFIHGGAYIAGNANRNVWDPRTLQERNVVLVTINYRLGPAGFLSTGDSVVPGNNGLMDQSLALRWVANNVDRFGGNPNKILVFGQSAGGASAHLHMLSPASKGLFQATISQSGTALNPWAFDTHGNTVKNGKRLAQCTGCPTNSTKEMVACLKAKDIENITRCQDTLYEFAIDPIIPFKPVVDGVFMQKTPEEVIRANEAADVPFLTGITTEDGAIRSSPLYAKPQLISEFSTQFDRLAPVVFFYDHLPNKDEITKKIKKFYFNNRPIDDQSRVNVTKLFTDAFFLASANKALELHLKYNHTLYNYAFGYRGRITYCIPYGGDPTFDYGVCHLDDLLYLFTPPALFFPGYVMDDNHKTLNRIMTKLWCNVPEFGNPTPFADPDFPTWTPTHEPTLDYLLIKSPSDISMQRDLYKERADFWRELNIY